MIRRTARFLLIFGLLSGCQSRRPLSVCELSKNYGAYRDQVLTVRGVYYYGLRQDCRGICASGPWPSFVDLVGSENSDWQAIAKAEEAVESQAKKGKRFEIWVTVHGQLKTQARLSPLGPC